jgi:hypothetical protein
LLPALSQWNCNPHSKTSDGFARSKGHDLQLCCQIYCTKECFLEKQNEISHFFTQNHKFTSAARHDRRKRIAFLKRESKIRSETTFSFQTPKPCREYHVSQVSVGHGPHMNIKAKEVMAQRLPAVIFAIIGKHKISDPVRLAWKDDLSKHSGFLHEKDTAQMRNKSDN